MFSALRSIVASLQGPSKRRNAGRSHSNASLAVDSLECRQLMTSLSMMHANSVEGATPKLSFASGEELSVGITPELGATGDFDGDGDMDLVYTRNVLSGNGGVLLNNGTGRYQLREGSLIDTDQTDVRTLDFDRDGDLDFIIAHFETVRVVRNHGAAGFSLAQTLSRKPGWIKSVALTDIDGDLDEDMTLVVDTTSQAAEMFVYRNQNGTFSDSPDRYVLAQRPVDAVYSDIDGDSDQDLVVLHTQGSNTPSRISIWRNNGSGSFHSMDGPGFGNGMVNQLLVADIDGDGDRDVAAVDIGSSQVHFARNRADGTFDTSFSITPGGTPIMGQFADFDQDGDVDFVTANHFDNKISILVNSGTGAFALDTSAELRTGDRPRSVLVTDVDQDGDPDIVVGNSAGTISVFRNSATSTKYAVFEVSLDSPPPGGTTVSVNYQTSSGTAVVGRDFANTTGTLRFGPGVTKQRIRVPIIADNVHEVDETFTVTLSQPINAGISGSSARGTITGNPEAGLPDLLSAGLSAPASVTVTGNGASFETVATIRNSGTASTGSDVYWTTAFYLSRDRVLDASDIYAGITMNAQPLSAGSETQMRKHISVPSSSDGFWNGSGTYYVVTAIDVQANVRESNENNNSGLGIGIDVAPFQVTLRNLSAPVISSLPTMELWPSQTISRRSIQAFDADGDKVSLSAQAVSLNWYLDQKYQFRLRGSYGQNSSGMNEKWIWSDATSGWFFITPQGQLFERTNPNGSPLTFRHVMDVSPAEHTDPTLLHDARKVTYFQPSAFTSGSTVIVNANTLAGATTSPFAVIVSATDGERTTNEGFAVTRANSMAERLDRALNFGHRTSYPTNILGQNEKYLSSSAGWHYILPDGRIHNDSTRQFVAQLTPAYYQHPQLLHNANVFQLDQQYGLFRDADNYALNSTGRNEKWLGTSSGQRYFLLSNGDLYRWNGLSGPASGTLVASLGSAYYNDPRLLHDAQARTMDALLGLNYRMTLLDTRTGLRFKLFTDRNGQSYRLEQDGRFLRMSSTGNEQLSNVDKLYYDFPSLLGNALN